MSLYTPSHFAAGEPAPVVRLLRDHPFATLVTPGVPEPFISHLPLLLMPDREPHGTLIGHFARANPHWRRAAGTESIAVFHGPHAYVSPSWYSQPERMVPTWNYATVHAHGTLEIVTDPTETRGLLEALIQRFEGSRPEPWQFRMPERERDAMVSAIVAFRMPLREVSAKFKFSQNRSALDRARVAGALRSEGYDGAVALAEWMERYAGGSGGIEPDSNEAR
jgi:transcriptional regulator